MKQPFFSVLSTGFFLVIVTNANVYPVCRNKIIDVYFLLDVSSSIRNEEFEKQKIIIEDIVNHFDIEARKTRVGISLFSHKYKNVVDFDTGSDKSATLKAIQNMKYLGGKTMIGQALYQVRHKVFYPLLVREGAQRVLIVFTDGMSLDNERTSAEAKLIRDAGVKVFVVGIGVDVNQKKMNDIASKPSDKFVHKFTSLDVLQKHFSNLTKQACTLTNQTFIGRRKVSTIEPSTTTTIASITNPTTSTQIRTTERENKMDQPIIVIPIKNTSTTTMPTISYRIPIHRPTSGILKPTDHGRTQIDCDAAVATDVVFMVGRNHFGQEKTDRILKACAEIMEIIRKKMIFRFGIIFDDCPLSKDLAVGMLTVESQLTSKMITSKRGSFASLLGKLQTEIFTPSNFWQVRKVGLLFVDNTIDMKDPQIVTQLKRAESMGIQLYVVSVNSVPRRRFENVQASNERIMHFNSFHKMSTNLPFVFTKRLCARNQKDFRFSL